MAPSWWRSAYDCVSLLLYHRSQESPPNLLQRLNERNALLPSPLPTDRKRLSVSFDPDVNKDTSLLSRLPLEVRLMVYEYALGGNLVHLVLGRRKVSHVCCNSSAKTDFDRSCNPEAAPKRIPRALGRPCRSNHLALVKSCRQIYDEAMPTMYSHNVFDVADLSAFVHFSRSVPSQRLAAVRMLNVDWWWDLPPLQSASTLNPTRAPLDDNTYLDFWKIVATEMPGLQELRIRLRDAWWMGAITLDDAWVRPLLQIRGLSTFQFDFREPQGFGGVMDLGEVQRGDFVQALRDSMCRSPLTVR